MTSKRDKHENVIEKYRDKNAQSANPDEEDENSSEETTKEHVALEQSSQVRPLIFCWPKAAKPLNAPLLLL